MIRTGAPVAFTLGPFKIYLFGLTLGLGLLAGVWVSVVEAGGRGLDRDRVLDLLTWTGAAGVAGARAGFVLLNLRQFLGNPVEILALSHGGLSWFGGLAAGFLTAAWYSRRASLPLWTVADAAAPGVALGYAVARIGCDIFGAPTSLPWGVVIDGVRRHPVQLYSSLGGFLMFVALRNMARKQAPAVRHGRVFSLYLLMYSALRFAVEFLRGEPVVALGMTAAQIVSLVMAAIAGSAIGLQKRCRGSQCRKTSFNASYY